MSNLIKPQTNSTNYKTIKDEVFMVNNFKGLDKKYVYFAYKEGKVIGQYSTLKEAEAVSKITERVWNNKEQYLLVNERLKELNKLSWDILYENILYEMGYNPDNVNNKKIIKEISEIIGYNNIDTIIALSEHIKGLV